MTDIYDQATAREEQDRELALQNARALNSGPKYNGECLNCGEPTTSGIRWCSPECRDDWQIREKIKGNRNA